MPGGMPGGMPGMPGGMPGGEVIRLTEEENAAVQSLEFLLGCALEVSIGMWLNDDYRTLDCFAFALRTSAMFNNSNCQNLKRGSENRIPYEFDG